MFPPRNICPQAELSKKHHPTHSDDSDKNTMDLKNCKRRDAAIYSPYEKTKENYFVGWGCGMVRCASRRRYRFLSGTGNLAEFLADDGDTKTETRARYCLWTGLFHKSVCGGWRDGH